MDKALLKHFIKRVINERKSLYVYADGGIFCYISSDTYHGERKPGVEGNDLVYFDVNKNETSRIEAGSIKAIQF